MAYNFLRGGRGCRRWRTRGPPPSPPDPARGVQKTRTSCRDLVVLVNETAESVPAPNAGGDCYRIRPSPNLDTSGRPKREASVRPLIVVVPQVLVEHPLKMTPTPDQHPIQTLLPHRPHPALGERVGVRRLNRGLDDLDAVSGEDVVEGAGELGIPIANKEALLVGPAHPAPGAGCGPLGNPGPIRVGGHAGQVDPPGPQLDGRTAPTAAAATPGRR